MHRRTTARLAAGGVASAVAAALLTSPAAAAPSAGGAQTFAAERLATISYRAAEHPYLVGTLAQVSALHGSRSPQARAVATALAANRHSLAGLLTGTLPRQSVLEVAVTKRDQAELAYATATVERYGKGTTVQHTKAANDQSKAMLSLKKSEAGLTQYAVDQYPGIDRSQLSQVLAQVDAGDLTTLEAIAQTSKYVFTDALVGSTASANLFALFGVAEIERQRVAGDPLAPASVYRAALTVAFVQHVYQTGLTGTSGLLTSVTSTDTKAALKAEDKNTVLVAGLLGGPGGKSNQVLGDWRLHIASGYVPILKYLDGGAVRNRQYGERALTSYINKITGDVHSLAPGLPSSTVKAEYSEHSFGTEQVFKDLASSSSTTQAAGYELAYTGAAHFADLASQIAVAADQSGNLAALTTEGSAGRLVTG